MEFTSILILFFFGLIGGFLSGLLGVGGGIIFVPIVTFFLKQLGIDGEELVKYVLANSFGTIFFAGVISTYKQKKFSSFYPKQIFLTASLAMITSFVVSYLITNQNWYSKRAFGILFLSLLVLTLIRFVIMKKGESIEVKDTKSYKYLITGFFTGIITALSGLGGGVVMIPLFTQYVKLNIKVAAAISIGSIPLIILPVLINYGIALPVEYINELQVGYILPHLIFPMVAGLVFAAPFGVAIAQKSSDKLLKIIFASLIVIVIFNTIGNLIK
ncbi:MAG: sulfite exporter TauE/SafE family protein [Bacteroidia bacterium]|nr:sulfite exporter TauE/SafE family protein [Bacteroidia bacterium]